MKNILSSVIDFGARDDLDLDIADYKKTRQGESVGGAGRLTTTRFNDRIRERQREKQREEAKKSQGKKSKGQDNKKNSANLDEALKSLQYKDPVDAQDMDDDEATKVFEALYESGNLPEGHGYEASISGKKNAIMAYMMLQEKK